MDERYHPWSYAAENEDLVEDLWVTTLNRRSELMVPAAVCPHNTLHIHQSAASSHWSTGSGPILLRDAAEAFVFDSNHEQSRESSAGRQAEYGRRSGGSDKSWKKWDPLACCRGNLELLWHPAMMLWKQLSEALWRTVKYPTGFSFSVTFIFHFLKVYCQNFDLVQTRTLYSFVKRFDLTF